MSDKDNDRDILDNEQFLTPEVEKQQIQTIKVIGVGGGGNNAVNHMYKQGIRDVSFVVLNTDQMVLKASPVPTKVLIGPGRGAGGNPERARKLAEENAERIAELFEDDTDMVFITAGMGGGTGTGAGPVVARIAKEKGILTVGIVTVPFMFEGKKRRDKAIDGAKEMSKNVDSLLVIYNQRLSEIYKSTDILDAFAKADETLLNAARSITDIITYQGIINRDFNDVDTTLRDGGSAIISTGYGEGPDRVRAAIQDALHSPLLRNTDIFSSKKLLLILYISDDKKNHPFNMDETNALNEFVLGIDRGNIDVMWGLYQQPGLDDKVRITILAAGFEKGLENEDLEETKTIEITTESMKDGNGYGEMPTLSSKGVVIDPKYYDNPENDVIRDFEYRPAIDRNPYTNYKHNIDTRSILDNADKFAIGEETSADSNLEKNTKASEVKNGKDSLIFGFDDFK